MNVKRLVLPGVGQCAVEDAEIDEQLAQGEVLVKNTLSLVQDGYELSLFTKASAQDFEQDADAPHASRYPGSACIGQVIAGPDAIPTGSRVFHHGHHATHAKLKASQVLPVPEGISNERAVFLAPVQAALTALRTTPPRIGEQALVIGMGLRGNLCAQLLAQSGVGRVASADPVGARLDKARACGLIEVYDLARKPLKDWVVQLDPRGAELVVEASGLVAYLEAAVDAVVPNGIVNMLVAPSGPVESGILGHLYRKGAALVGGNPCRLSKEVRKADQRLLMEWLRWEKLKVDALATQRMHYSEARQAYAGLRDQPGDFSGVLLYYP